MGDGVLADLASGGRPGRGEEGITVVEVCRWVGAEEEEAAAAVEVAVGEEDAGGAEAADYATVADVVEGPGVEAGGAVLAGAAAGRGWRPAPERGVHWWRRRRRRRNGRYWSAIRVSGETPSCPPTVQKSAKSAKVEYLLEFVFLFLLGIAAKQDNS